MPYQVWERSILSIECHLEGSKIKKKGCWGPLNVLETQIQYLCSTPRGPIGVGAWATLNSQLGTRMHSRHSELYNSLLLSIFSIRPFFLPSEMQFL